MQAMGAPVRMTPEDRSGRKPDTRVARRFGVAALGDPGFVGKQMRSGIEREGEMRMTKCLDTREATA